MTQQQDREGEVRIGGSGSSGTGALCCVRIAALGLRALKIPEVAGVNRLNSFEY